MSGRRHARRVGETDSFSEKKRCEASSRRDMKRIEENDEAREWVGVERQWWDKRSEASEKEKKKEKREGGRVREERQKAGGKADERIESWR